MFTVITRRATKNNISCSIGHRRIQSINRKISWMRRSTFSRLGDSSAFHSRSVSPRLMTVTTESSIAFRIEFFHEFNMEQEVFPYLFPRYLRQPRFLPILSYRRFKDISYFIYNKPSFFIIINKIFLTRSLRIFLSPTY